MVFEINVQAPKDFKKRRNINWNNYCEKTSTWTRPPTEKCNLIQKLILFKQAVQKGLIYKPKCVYMYKKLKVNLTNSN